MICCNQYSSPTPRVATSFATGVGLAIATWNSKRYHNSPHEIPNLVNSMCCVQVVLICPCVAGRPLAMMKFDLRIAYSKLTWKCKL